MDNHFWKTSLIKKSEESQNAPNTRKEGEGELIRKRKMGKGYECSVHT